MQLAQVIIKPILFSKILLLILLNREPSLLFRKLPMVFNTLYHQNKIQRSTVRLIYLKIAKKSIVSLCIPSKPFTAVMAPV